jgi:hypothetical protein
MAYKIISEDEALLIEAIIILLFGEPGIGKTSISFTAENPLLEDFDGGLQRAIGRKKALKMDSWEDAVEFHRSGQLEQLGIKTLIFDTVGTMLDNYVSQSVIRDDPKNAKKDGALALGGYGAMKNVFNAFVNEMKSKRIDLIFIAHDDDENVKDSIKKKPKITGGSYDIIKGVADMVGYMETEGDRRVIDFNPCDRHVGKNSAQIQKQVVPNFSDPEYATFMARIISDCKAKMNEMTKAQEDALKLVQDNQEKIAAAKTIEELNPVADAIMDMSQTYRIQLSKPLNEKYGLFFADLLKDVKYTVQMDTLVEMVKNTPEMVKKQLRSSLMAKVKELGFKWDEGMGMYLDKTGKPSVIPDDHAGETGEKPKSDQVQNDTNANVQTGGPANNQLQLKAPDAKKTGENQTIKEPKIF